LSLKVPEIEMKSPIKDSMADISKKDIVKPKVADDSRSIVATLFGWNKTTPISETFENRVDDPRASISPLKQHEECVSNSLHRYHDFVRKKMPYNLRM
jgi:hypothetical protein